MWYWRVLFLNSLALATACGTSRSTRSQNCSNLRAVVDQKSSPANASTIESYDPSAALLLFKATADKVSIESRCNARLVNKLVAKHKLSDGQLIDAQAPINFDQLEIHVQTGESNFELHTSAHCFYRVWDSRITNQVKNNPAIGLEPVRSLLSDLKTRYQLYRSMLTTPQKIVTYLPDGTPVSFDYKLEVTPLYEQFFAEMDAAKSNDLEVIVGREFSKSSLLLDELISQGCKTDEKMLTHMGSVSLAEAKKVTDPMQMLSFAQAKDKAVLDLIRSRYMSGGRHKLCFSQTDMVAVPVVFTGERTSQQKMLLAEIAKAQEAKNAIFTSHLRGADKGKFIPEITTTTVPLAPPSGTDACYWSNKFPGFSITESFSQFMEKKYVTNWVYSKETTLAGLNQMKFVFPNLKVDATSSEGPATMIGNLMLEYAKCEISGSNFEISTMKCGGSKSGNGRCPPIANTSSPTTLEEELAKEKHKYIEKSLRLASTAPIHQLRRMRESSSLALTMPVTSLHDYVISRCQTENDPECRVSEVISSALTKLSGKYIANVEANPPGSPDSRQSVDLVAANNLLQFTATDADLQFHCKFSKRANGAYIDGTSTLFNTLSDEAKTLLYSDLAAAGVYSHWSMGSRFLFLKCISMGMQRLYNDFDTYSGLLHGLGFANVSFVKSEAVGNRYNLDNAEMVQSGRPINMPFAGLFVGDEAKNLSSAEAAARLLGGPHLQISYCTAGGAEKSGICGDLLDSTTLGLNTNFADTISDFPLVEAHLTFTTALPNWLPDGEKAKYGGVGFPAGNYSPASSRYFFTAGDSGTTITSFGLFPIFMLSTVQDRPVSGGLAVIPSTGGQQVQSSKGGTCR
jgi:hypothetical protein